MNKQGLKHWSRMELAKKLAEVLEENQQLKTELEEARSQLAGQSSIQETGSLEQAALQLSCVLKAADEAVRICLEAAGGRSSEDVEIPEQTA